MRRGRFTRGLRRVAFALTGAFALVALVPGAAVAASFGTLSYPVRGPVNARVDRATTVSSACPAGSHVLGGGQYVFAATNDSIVHSSAPFDGADRDAIPDDGWRSRIDSFNGAHNTLTEYAICSTKQPVYRAKSVTLHAPGQPLLRSQCPASDSVLGGGVYIGPGYSSAYITSSDPAEGASWEGHAVAGLAGVPSQEVTDWAICAPVQPIYRRAYSLAPHSDFGEAAASCPAGTRVVGGGVRTPDFGPNGQEDDVRPTISSPYDGPDANFVPDNGWQIEADNWNALYDFWISATAICLG